MVKATPWTPDRIRALRGALSRADFAAAIGVSPLTVYRWELPDGAREARRPRGALARRLAAREAAAPRRGGVTDATATREPGADELAEVLPIQERLLHGDFKRVESELVALLSHGRARSGAVRALATQALARHLLWSRGDALGAFATLLPLLGEADEGRLPPSVELEVQVTAALLHASLDGRLFDAGKTNAHVARARRLPIAPSDAQRFLLWLAQLHAATVLNDPALLEHALSRAEEAQGDLPWPILRCFAVEARIIEHYYARRPGSAAHELHELVRLTAAAPFPLFHVRAVIQAARGQIDEGAPPGEVLAAIEGARALCLQAAVAPGLHLLHAAYAEGEARLRDGQLAAAERALLDGIAAADELRWSWGSLPFFLARLYLLTGRARDVRPAVERALAIPCELYVGITDALRLALGALADVVDGRDVPAALERLDAAVRALERHNAWTFVRRSLVLTSAAAAVLAGGAEAAERALRHAERVIDVIPAAWAVAAIRWLRGVSHLRRGDDEAAQASLEAALTAFERHGDRVQVALTRRLLAGIARDRGEAGASERLAASEACLRRLGIAELPLLAARAARRPRAPAAPVPAEAAAPARLAESVQRLAVRGMSVELVQRELVAALHELYPDAALRLAEVDSQGGAQVLASAGPAELPPREEVVFGDGTGRRFQLHLAARRPLADARRVMNALTSVAGLALEVASLRGLTARVGAAAPEDGEPPELPGFVAASPAMRRLKLDLARLARSRATIIITGESGAGKEVVARAIHDLSIRAGRPYVAFNCAAVPRELFEGQLFGYRKGAFTGAASDQPGVLRAADGGTVFLDEIAELPLEIQPKLLRFLENGEVFPLGERRPVQVDVRVLAATFRDLEGLVRDRQFREDLYYRLQVVPLRVPPLRERPEDIVALARHFIHKLTPAGQEAPVLAPEAALALATHTWPGNVRELRNVLERSLAFGPLPPVIGVEHLRLR